MDRIQHYEDSNRNQATVNRFSVSTLHSRLLSTVNCPNLSLLCRSKIPKSHGRSRTVLSRSSAGLTAFR